MGREEGMKGGGRETVSEEEQKWKQRGGKGKAEERGLKRTGDCEKWEERWDRRKGDKVVFERGLGWDKKG